MAGIGIRCYGKVQGVFFRASTKTIAEDLGLFGWVRNEEDGTVLIHAEGSEDLLRALEAWCHKGSDFSNVLQVQSWDEPEESLKSFEILRS